MGRLLEVPRPGLNPRPGAHDRPKVNPATVKSALRRRPCRGWAMRWILPAGKNGSRGQLAKAPGARI
jgi:hypothetical protein